MSPDDTNPGGPIELTADQRDIRRILLRVEQTYAIASKTYEEIMALQPRVRALETEVSSLKARQQISEEDTARLRARVSALEGKRTPPTRPEIPE